MSDETDVTVGRVTPLTMAQEGNGAEGATQALLTALERASTPEAAQAIAELYERVHVETRTFEARKAFDDSMARIQAQVRVVVKDKANEQTRSKYAKTETIIKKIKPILEGEGMSIRLGEEASPHDGMIRYTIKCAKGGYSETDHVDLPPDNTGIKGTTNKTLVHALKSSGSYAQGILLRRMFNLADADSDDDGNAAGTGVITDSQVSVMHAAIELCADPEAVLAKTLAYGGVDDLCDYPAAMYAVALRAVRNKQGGKA